MTDEHTFYVEKLPEGSRIKHFSDELKQFVTSDLENLQAFLLKLFNSCHRFVFENIETVFSHKIELNLIYQTELYEKTMKEKEKTVKIKEPAKRKSTAFHAGNSIKGEIFVNVEERLSLLKHGYPTFILNFVMTYFHEIIHCCYLNFRSEQEIFSLESSLLEKFLEIKLPEEWKKLQSKHYYKKG